MFRDNFQNARASLKLYPPLPITEFFKRSSEDPLYFARHLFNRFIIRCSQVAVPYGPAAFDEASMETKARTRSKSYMPNKPSKYAVRFYALVGHAFSYLFSLFDKRSGNFEDTPAAMRYTEKFRALKTPLEKLYTDLAKTEDLKKSKALWIAQIGHMTEKQSNEINCNVNYILVFMDNFYSRHTFATNLKKFNDNDITGIGTVRCNIIDSANRDNVLKGFKIVKDKPIILGCWKVHMTQ